MYFTYNLVILLFFVASLLSFVNPQDQKVESKCLENCNLRHSQTVSPEKSIVFGPGLRSGFTLPARYFFLQAVDQIGNNFTESPRGEFKVKITELNTQTYVWNQILNRNDGSFIVRYRMFQTLNGLQINITYNDIHVSSSPYIIEGIQYHETCNCPTKLPEWLTRMNCPENYSQIENDLKVFPSVDMLSVIKEAKERYNIPGAYSFCHYSIIENQIYKKCYGQYVGFSMFMDELLLSLTRKTFLPDVEFITNLGDWPLENKAVHENPIPIFSWCGSKSTRDIVMPTYDLTESSLEMMGRVMLDVLSVQGNSPIPWDSKVDKGFWRGRDSRMERLDLVDLSRKHPDLINASLTNFFFFRDKEKLYGPKTDHISFFDFFEYKYQINVDGTVAAYRFPYLMAGDSVVLKQDSEYYEHFYGQLLPMVHYIPFKRDLSDLVQKLEWAKTHDNEVRKIAQNARLFVAENLLPQNIFCYYVLLLKNYSTRLLQPPSKQSDMEFVSQPVTNSNCNCQEGKSYERVIQDEL